MTYHTAVEHTHIRSGAATVLAGVYMLVMSVASPAFSQQYECVDLPTAYEATYEEHVRLYEHALIAGFPDATDNTCSAVVDISEPIIKAFVSVTESEVDDVLWTGALQERGAPDDVDIYRDGNGNAYISCRNAGGDYLARVFVNVSWDRDSVFRFHVLVEAKPLRQWSFDEEMNFHTLQSTDGQHEEVGTFDPQMVVIENTDSFGEFLTDMAEILGDSCAFDFAAHFVWHLASDKESLTVVGHSLGGAAAQHVTQHPMSNAGNVRGYSFSSFGLDDGTSSRGDVFSYYINGDPFVEGFSDRDQVGTVIRYNPPRWYGLHTGLISRHSLRSVQDSICKCIEGHRGSLTIERRAEH